MRSTIVKSMINVVGGMAFGAVLSYGFATHGIGIDHADDDKPVNSPSFETHRTAAIEMCGGPVLEPGPETYATHVIVVKLDGTMVRMPIKEAWDRAKSESRADDIWSIAVCKSDVVSFI